MAEELLENTITEMYIEPDRIGKAALILAMSSSREEEDCFKKQIQKDHPEFRVAVTFVTGLTGELNSSFVKAIVGCSLQNKIVKKSDTQVHAVLHAALDALKGVAQQVPAEASLKLKVAVVSDDHWVAVGIYGDSAFYPITNHERCSLGVMHLR